MLEVTTDLNYKVANEKVHLRKSTSCEYLLIQTFLNTQPEIAWWYLTFYFFLQANVV